MTANDVVKRLVDTFGPAIENDEEINGGDAVNDIVELYHFAKEALGAKVELPIDEICHRLLDSEEHAVESAIPPVAEDAVEIIRSLNAECGRLEAHVQDRIAHRDEAALFMTELLESVETLTGIADMYGARTLADLMYLHSAIANGGFIDYYPGESSVLDIVRPLPSGEKWVGYIQVEYMASSQEEAPEESIGTEPSAGPASQKSSVHVKHWDCYNSVTPTANTHQFDVDDQRTTNGQMYLDIGALEGNVDDLLGVTMEVNTNPLNGIDHVPCAHVHFDGDNLAVSLFKVGDKILMRPEAGVTVDAFQARFNADGPVETMYWIDA